MIAALVGALRRLVGRGARGDAARELYQGLSPIVALESTRAAFLLPLWSRSLGISARTPTIAAQDQDGIRVFELIGPMTKYGASFSPFAGTLAMQAALRAAREADSVKGVMIRVDSPGGMIAGVDDLALEVARTAKTKPVAAFIEDLGASAAYYAISQAGVISANAGAEIGSIGTYGVLYDTSQAATEAGVRAVVIKAGEFKAIGVRGAPITDEQIAELQRQIAAINDRFVERVAAGRRVALDVARLWADGRLWTAPAAQQRGLIDRTESFDEAMNGLRSAIGARARSPGPTETTGPRRGGAAPMNERDDAGRPLIEARNDPSVDSERANMTMMTTHPHADPIEAYETAVRTAMKDEGCPRHEATRRVNRREPALTRAFVARRNLEREQHAAMDSDALYPERCSAHTAAPASDPIEAYETAVRATMKDENCARHEAVGRVNKREPALRVAFVAAFNMQRGRPCAVPG